MSVEEAREAIHKYCDLADFAYSSPGMTAAFRAQNQAIDRLILEVQASMPCYPQCVIGQRVPNCYDDAVSGGPPDSLCPSCTARMKLKETADAR